MAIRIALWVGRGDVRQALATRLALDPDVRVIESCWPPVTAPAEPRNGTAETPDVVITDVNMDLQRAPGVAHCLARLTPRPGMVVVAAHYDAAQARAANAAGHAYVLHELGTQALPRAIRRAAGQGGSGVGMDDGP